MSKNDLQRDFFERFILTMANIISWLVIGFIVICLIYIIAVKFQWVSPKQLQMPEAMDPVKSTCLTD